MSVGRSAIANAWRILRLFFVAQAFTFCMQSVLTRRVGREEIQTRVPFRNFRRYNDSRHFIASTLLRTPSLT